MFSTSNILRWLIPSARDVHANPAPQSQVTTLKQPKLKIVYFEVRARAETTRMALAYGGFDWEDYTPMEYWGVSWKTAKEQGKAPFGQLPLLDVDGVLIPQTIAQSRYAAGLPSGDKCLIPSNPVTAALCDGFFAMAEEMYPIARCVNVYTGQTFDDKVREYFTETLPTRLERLITILGTDKNFFCGDRVYYCDLYLYHIFDLIRLVKPDFFNTDANFSNIVQFMARVEALPGLAKYLATRPRCIDIGTKPMLEPVTV